MSCFIVSNACMQRVVTVLSRMESNYFPIGQMADIHFASQFARHGRERVLSELGTKLFHLNIQAFNSRYFSKRVDADAYLAAAPFRCADRPGLLTMSLAERVDGCKALECLFYQCGEDGPDKSALFAQLSAALDKVRADIVSDLPAYQIAPWG